MTARARNNVLLGATAAVLYFSEGLPYGIVIEFAGMYMRVHGIDLTKIGLVSAIGLAWTLKFIWSPLIDAAGTYRRWVLACVGIIGLTLAAMGATESVGITFYVLLTILALASATQDIAVDAFTIRATPRDFLGPVNSIRVIAYRAALMSPGFLAIIGDKWGWPAAFYVAAICAAIVFAFALAMPDDRGAVMTERPSFIEAFKRWIKRPRGGTLLAIVLLYRLGEMTIVPMIKPYWLDRHYSAAQVGEITSIIGVIVSIIGASIGGALVARFGLYRSLLWLGIAQAASNLGYSLVATFSTGGWSIYAAAIVENLGYGLGTAAFLAFLMSICDREHAATEYALLTAAFGLTGRTMASFSGAIAQHAGYPAFFWLTVFLGIPGLLLLPRVRQELES